MDIDSLDAELDRLLATLVEWIGSPLLYAQLGVALLAVLLAYSLAGLIRKSSPLLRQQPTGGAWFPLRRLVHNAGYLLFPLLTVLALGVAVNVASRILGQSWLLQICQSLAVVFTLYSLVSRFISNAFISAIFNWVIVPIAILHIFGWLEPTIDYLETIAIEVGNIRVSAYGLARAVVFGSILFWLGRISSAAGQQIIRRQEVIDVETREVFAQLFVVLLYSAIFVLLLQIMGINLTALAVFGGALGVGLGFGLQAIASNFISGIIILIDRSIRVGDYIEIEDGVAGKIREINMRSTLLETYDGKDIMVPNGQFITSKFVNWTHNNKEQRYSLEFQVAYSTDIPSLFELVESVVRSHPQVIDGPDVPPEKRAEAEIDGFGDSGIDILVEFWMEGIDDGENHVAADLRLMIWRAFKEHGIEIPFPQREVRLLGSAREKEVEAA